MAAPRHQYDLIGGRYRLDASIASGGMADVWRGTDMQLHRQVAIKMLRTDTKSSDPNLTERFRREARALARLTHPNIVPVFDCIEEDDGQIALVMRLIEGKSLRGMLDDAGAPGTRTAGTISAYLTVHIGKCIAAALAKAHSENILHRDIKPANILVTPGGEVLLTDFGIAKPLKASEDDGTDLTKADTMMGTAKYLSPEQVQGRPLDERADIYSLGLVLYECLAGNAPFKGENDQATAVARLQRDPTPLGGIRQDVPSTVINVIHRMLRRKPEHRYANCNEVVRALDEAMANLHDAITPAEGLVPSLEPQTRTRPVQIDPLMPKRNARTLSSVPDPVTPARGNPRLEREERRPARDVTPKGAPVPRVALPSRQRTSMRRNYVPVALLLVAALVMSVMLWKGLQNTRSTGTPSVVDNIEVTHVTMTGVTSYDPNGDGNGENEQMVSALLDNDPTTSWTTVCYGNKYFGSKEGVGLVITLSGIGIGKLSTNFLTAPWSAEVYASTADATPATFSDWGMRVGDLYGDAAGPAAFDVTAPAHKVLLLLREVGRSTTCSNRNPYKGILSELSFTSTK